MPEYPGPLRFISVLTPIRMHYVLIYDLAPDYLDRRPEFRGAHIELAREAHARGDLFLGGAFADPADTAMLVFQGDSPDAAEAFARADPYVANGLVKSWTVRPWTTVIGDHAAKPI